MHSPFDFSITQHQAAMSTQVFRVIFNHLSVPDHIFYFLTGNHPARQGHLLNGVREKENALGCSGFDFFVNIFHCPHPRSFRSFKIGDQDTRTRPTSQPLLLRVKSPIISPVRQSESHGAALSSDAKLLRSYWLTQQVL